MPFIRKECKHEQGKKIFMLVVIAAVISLGLAGCKDKTDEHPNGDHPAKEHPTGEHPE